MDLDRKFKSFSQIIGQERAIRFLKKVIAGKKIPHAYLFTGIAGVGKTTTALAFAQAINCPEPVDMEGCGRCRICRQVISGNFPDILFLEPDGQNIKIEQIRDLNRGLSFKTVAGRYRVVIISQAEMMTEEAANSFLKSLEEPPPGNVMILKVTEPLDLLTTIVSRCQKVSFRPLPLSLIEGWLRSEMTVDEERASLAARISGGSLGRAIHVCDMDFLNEREGSISDIMQLPFRSREQTLEMALEYAKMAKKGYPEGNQGAPYLFELMGIWKSWYRDLILMKVKGPVSMLINIDFTRKLNNLSEKISIKDLIEGFMVIDQAQRDLMRNPNTGLMIEDTLLNLRRLSSP